MGFFVAMCFPPSGVTSQNLPDGYRNNNSDWWSHTGKPDEGNEGIIQKRELPASNFEVLGLKLEDEIFDRATEKLGKTTVVRRGDASTGRSQICYSSVGKREKIHLIFEKGELNDALYLFTDGPGWDGSDQCTGSSLITSNLSTGSGLHLGQSSAQVRALLGKASFLSKDKIIYSMMVQKKTSAADFAKLKKQNPELKDDELHRNYESYTFGAYIEVRFAKDRLIYLAISKTESY